MYIETLFQVLNYDNRCINDTVSWTCINENDNYVLWDIKSGDGKIYSVSLSQNNPIGRKYSRVFGSSTITAEVTTINSTYMASTITISVISTFIGNFIVCNAMEEMLDNLINPTINSKRCCIRYSIFQ